MKRWQSNRRPNFRSQLILSEFFASQTAIKKCLRLGQFFSLFLVGREREKQCGRAEKQNKNAKKNKNDHSGTSNNY